MARLRISESVADENSLPRRTSPSQSPSPSVGSDKENSTLASGKSTSRTNNPSMPLGDRTSHSPKRRRLADRDGVQRMVTPSEEEPEEEQDEVDDEDDVDGEDSGSVTPTPILSTQYYDPHQPMAERHILRKGMRDLNNEANDNRQEWIQPGNSALLDAITKADSMYSNVKQTSDATIDSRFLVTAGDLAYRKTNQMVMGDNAQGIDVDEFVGKCIAFMRPDAGSNTRTRNANADDDDDDEDGDALDWAKLGRACFVHNSRPSLASFLLGPLSLQKRTRQPIQRRAANATQRNLVETRPEEMDSTQVGGSEATATAMSRNILKLIRRTQRQIHAWAMELQEQGKSEEEVKQELRDNGFSCEVMIPLFKLVINPQSFGQTIENIFYFSFLIKDGIVGLDTDEDDVLCVLTDLADSADDAADKPQAHKDRSQSIFALDHALWREMIEVFDLTECLIPDRGADEAMASQVSANGWYA